MPNARLSISVAPEIQAAIRAHADAAGLDVSAYMVAAAIAQMAADDAASVAFASLDAGNTAATGQTAPPVLPAFEELSPQEQDLVRTVVASALGSDRADVA